LLDTSVIASRNEEARIAPGLPFVKPIFPESKMHNR
jgi:hypothetical protein